MDQKINELTAREILDKLLANRQRLYDLGVRKLGLFGSYVRGEQKPNSDLDFIVALATYTFDHYMDVKFFLEELFGHEVDLVPEDSIKPRLKPYIMREVQYVEGF